MKKPGINLATLKNDSIGKWVQYENKKANIKEKGRLVSWNTVSAFVVFGVKGGDPYINKKTTPVYAEHIKFCDAPGMNRSKKKEDQ